MRKKIRLAQNKDDLQDLGSDDLLSRLSDDILVSILSYLPLKDAAVTSNLSRRWRYLWCHRVCLDFDDKERSDKIGEQLYYSSATWKKYIDLFTAERNKYISRVNCIIRQHKSPNIDEFKICFNLDKNAKGAIGNWIEFAISKNVQTLELDLRDGFSVFNRGNYVFPNKIFDRKCKSSLKRSSFNVPVKPCANSMGIKFLKALILKRVDVNDEGIKNILSNCPVLEHLSILGSCKLVKVEIHGKGLALKNLEIICCYRLESIEICDSNIVLFNCKRFNFEDSPISLRLDNLQKLEKIFIRDHKMKISHLFCQLSCSIPYLQVLELLVYPPQRDMQFFPFPELPKLKQLIMEFRVLDGSILSVLTSLVEACPNLQRFIIKLLWMSSSATFGLMNRQAAKQPHQHLEVVEIGEYHGWTCDHELVMYFIENCVALKKLVIKPYLYVQEAGLTANEITEKKNAIRNRVQQQLEPKTPVGVELELFHFPTGFPPPFGRAAMM